MNFENQLAAVNEWHFFREFTYSKTTFRPIPTQRVELADALIWIGDLLIVFQLKEREALYKTSVEAEKNWFNKKVLGKATRQIRDTLTYLHNSGNIEIQNQRGHALSLDLRAIRELHKVVVYLPNDILPETYRRLKYYKSRTAGFIHIIGAKEYLGIVRTLLTPAEVADYLNFREGMIKKWEMEIADLQEQALVGQYLAGDFEAKPSVNFIEHLVRLEHRADEWDMSGIISRFPDLMSTASKPTEYYPIVRELALLKRNELREFKKRFQLSMERARANKFVQPFRIACPRTACGFVFIPVTTDTLPYRRNGLNNFTLAHKYELKLPKCIGVSIAIDTDKWFTTEWMYAEFPWEQDPQLEEMLRSNYPFRKLKQGELLRYTYNDPK